jgi:hypothetical protein
MGTMALILYTPHEIIKCLIIQRNARGIPFGIPGIGIPMEF